MPLLIDYAEVYAESVPLLSICSGRTEEGAREIAEDLGLTFPVAYDADKTVAVRYQPREEGLDRQITAFPFLVVVDADGTVIYAQGGRLKSVDALAATLEQLELLPTPAAD
jgi:peroxiredoxin